MSLDQIYLIPGVVEDNGSGEDPGGSELLWQLEDGSQFQWEDGSNAEWEAI